MPEASATRHIPSEEDDVSHNGGGIGESPPRTEHDQDGNGNEEEETGVGGGEPPLVDPDSGEEEEEEEEAEFAIPPQGLSGDEDGPSEQVPHVQPTARGRPQRKYFARAPDVERLQALRWCSGEDDNAEPQIPLDQLARALAFQLSKSEVSIEPHALGLNSRITAARLDATDPDSLRLGTFVLRDGPSQDSDVGVSSPTWPHVALGSYNGVFKLIMQFIKSSSKAHDSKGASVTRGRQAFTLGLPVVTSDGASTPAPPESTRIQYVLCPGDAPGLWLVCGDFNRIVDSFLTELGAAEWFGEYSKMDGAWPETCRPCPSSLNAMQVHDDAIIAIAPWADTPAVNYIVVYSRFLFVALNLSINKDTGVVRDDIEPHLNPLGVILHPGEVAEIEAFVELLIVKKDNFMTPTAALQFNFGFSEAGLTGSTPLVLRAWDGIGEIHVPAMLVWTDFRS